MRDRDGVSDEGLLGFVHIVGGFKHHHLHDHFPEAQEILSSHRQILISGMLVEASWAVASTDDWHNDDISKPPLSPVPAQQGFACSAARCFSAGTTDTAW